jgi:UDP-N-acetylmuramoyl-L-alanyl-D-glutamate--2,6-diaminopimelate ligase
VPGYPRPTSVDAVPLRDIAEVAGARLHGDVAAGPDGSVVVTGVTHDSAGVRPGDLYAALPGTRRHGAEFAAAAVVAGAVAVLTDPAGAALLGRAGAIRTSDSTGVTVSAEVPVLVVSDPRAVLGEVAATVYGHPTRRLPVIGITGTAGKTSTAYLIEAALRAGGHRTALTGTVETRIGDLVIDSVRTTPEATDLHALFATALEQGVTAAVIEVSSHALVYGRVNGVQFAVGGWTNFGSDHLDFHADLDEYFAAKAKLFDGRCRTELLNADDPAVARLLDPAAYADRPNRSGYSAAGDPAASWRATELSGPGDAGLPAAAAGEPPSRGTVRWGTSFTVRGPDGVLVRASVALPGEHNVANALLAIAAASAIGVDPAEAAAGVAACRGVPGRLELVNAPGDILGVVDYAHKPDAVVAVLGALRAVSAGRIIAVIGAGGDRDRHKRPHMGEAAANGADVVIVTDDNPRSEDPAAIRFEVRVGAEKAGVAEVVEVAGRRDAIAEAVRLARPGDVVVLLGKGHEIGQEVNGVVAPFDDRVELAMALHGQELGGQVDR